MIVPPTQRHTIIRADQKLANASALDLVETAQNDSRDIITETARMKYHHPAISFLDDPPHKLFARKVEYWDIVAPIVSLHFRDGF